MGESVLDKLGQWVIRTPLRSLNQAYDAALMIRTIEIEHFNGELIRSIPNHSDSVTRYFRGQLRKQRQIIDIRLAEFRVSSSLSNLPELNITLESSLSGSDDESLRSSARGVSQYYSNGSSATRSSNGSSLNESFANGSSASGSSTNGSSTNGSPRTSPNRFSDPLPNVEVSQLSVLDKLQFIDTVITPYKQPHPDPEPDPVDPTAPEPAEDPVMVKQASITPSGPAVQVRRSSQARGKTWQSQTNRTGVLPRSILRTMGRLKREVSDYEEDVVDDFRQSRSRTVTSLKFLVLLATLPLVAQLLSKNYVFDPLVNRFLPQDPSIIRLDGEYEERALLEFEHFREKLEFRRLVIGEEEETEAATEAELRDKAIELVQKYGSHSVDGLKNVLADIISLGVFAWLIFIGREEISILKAFLDQIVYGLSDSAKAFIIILFTDVFVGYHSPHGWEVLLEGLARHFGIPENKALIFGFIATFPVFLDTLFKYWIFRYLNRVSPSAVATYKTMND